MNDITYDFDAPSIRASSGQSSAGRLTSSGGPREFITRHVTPSEQSAGCCGASPVHRLAEADAESGTAILPDGGRGVDVPAVPAEETHAETPKPAETPALPVLTREALEAGARRVAAVITARRLQREREAAQRGWTWEELGQVLSVDHTTLHRWCNKVRDVADADLRAAHLADKPKTGRPPQNPLTPEERQKVRSLLLTSNRNRNAGSMEGAVRRAIRDGVLREELVETFKARDAAGQAMLTASERNKLFIPKTTVRASRNGRDAWLTFNYSPGSLMFTKDAVTGEERYIEAGEFWTIDDGTMNLAACVPYELPGAGWAENWGVMVGRFQFLLIVDHRTLFIPGFSYTARPRGSYRAEDLLATLDIAFREHGLPGGMIMEHGVSASLAISEALARARVEIERAQSPHQKVVEMVFDKLWERLSYLPGQVGRFRGDEKDLTGLIDSCRRGTKDPRKYFPLLSVLLTELRAAIAEWNLHWVNSSRYGRWQPGELWQAQSPRHLRAVRAEDAWMFAPHVSDALKVRGSNIETSVRMAEGFSQVFTFTSEWLHNYVDARVRLHFNPFLPGAMEAAATLGEAWHGTPAGAFLGHLVMNDQQARRTRRQWGYSDETDDGGKAARMAAQALHRSVVAIRPDGKPGLATVEQRDGDGAGQRAQNFRETASAGEGLAVSRQRVSTEERREALERRPKKSSDYDEADGLGWD